MKDICKLKRELIIKPLIIADFVFIKIVESLKKKRKLLFFSAKSNVII